MATVLKNAGRLLSDKTFVAAAMLMLEVLATALIIWRVPYTEIDWTTYMEHITQIVAGERNYLQITGATGHLPYPAGHVYVYTALYYMTDRGQNIFRAQILFGLLYLVQIALVFRLYAKIRTVPAWVMILACLSRRIHSIFVLRLFNDCFASTFVYAFLNLLLDEQYVLACVAYSVAVSVKMNVLLFAPALLLILLQSFSIKKTSALLAVCAAVQVGLAVPFLVGNWWSYVSRAFNLGRKFIYFWSVNLKFVPEPVFLSSAFGAVLLALHLGTLFLFASVKWCRADGGIVNVVLNSLYGKVPGKLPSADYVVEVLLTANFIGVVFSRTLHYQFYVWYFHSLPLLLCLTCIPVPLRFLLSVTTEVVWNIYPSNAYSSLVLAVCNLSLLLALWASPSARKTTKQA